MFFALNPQRAFLADICEDLINSYRIVRAHPEPLLRRLSRLAVNRRTFMTMRAKRSDELLSRVIRFMYLNRTAFNGLFRVNQQGQFNVPYGCKPGTTTCDATSIRQASRRLRRSQLSVTDFRTSLQQVSPGDVIYADPPYTVMHNSNGFRRYNENIFSWEDQQALADLLNRKVRLGAHVIVSNAFHPELSALYANDLYVRTPVCRPANVAADPEHRKFADELLLVSRSVFDEEEYLRELLLDLGLHSGARQPLPM